MKPDRNLRAAAIGAAVDVYDLLTSAEAVHGATTYFSVEGRRFSLRIAEVDKKSVDSVLADMVLNPKRTRKKKEAAK